jgi:hypothetical protein
MPKCAVCGRFSMLAAAVYHCCDCGNAVCRPSHSDCSTLVEWADKKVGNVAGGFVYKDARVRCKKCAVQRAAECARAALASWTTCPKCGGLLEMSYAASGLRCSQRDCPWYPQEIESFALHVTRGRELLRGNNYQEAAREYEQAGLYPEAGRIRRLAYEGQREVTETVGHEDVNEVLRQLALRAPIGATIACPRCEGRLGIWGIQGASHRCPHCHANLRVADLATALKALL